jgi:hypothetical protein
VPSDRGQNQTRQEVPCPPLRCPTKTPRHQRVRMSVLTSTIRYAPTPPQPRTMNDDVRAELSATLRRRGWTYKQIGRHVGLSANGAKCALDEVTQPGRYADDFEEEVDHAPPAEAW